MKTTIAIASLILSASIIPAASFAAEGTVDRASPPVFIQDSAITMKVKSKLAAEQITSVGRIQVDTDAGGVVYLSGTARSQTAIDKAVSIAQATEHVSSVNNALTVNKDD